ncbi:MAG: quinone-dependent dihydroorotate dehydrogenase [Acidiferrobacteraceae bacterium]
MSQARGAGRFLWIPRILYQALRPLLFLIDPERAHRLTLGAWDRIHACPGVGRAAAGVMAPPDLPIEIMGLTLPNPVGLAAGLDKDGRHVRGLAALGFGWLELGTVTPRPQAGNPKPRLFRLVKERALINRMGFNNDGAAALARRLAGRRPPPVIGVNIGKNRDTPLEQAERDYILGLHAVHAVADYVTINVSSPNTPGLRLLQEADRLARLLRRLKEEQARIADATGRYVPIAVKLAPEPESGLETVAGVLAESGVDGVIAVNTTLSRPEPGGLSEAGGLSGAPLRERATDVLRRLRQVLPAPIPLIGVGGIASAEDAWSHMLAGADAVQLFTGLIYHGPGLVSEVAHGLRQKTLAYGNDLAQALLAARRDRLSGAP